MPIRVGTLCKSPRCAAHSYQRELGISRLSDDGTAFVSRDWCERERKLLGLRALSGQCYILLPPTICDPLSPVSDDVQPVRLLPAPPPCLLCSSLGGLRGG